MAYKIVRKPNMNRVYITGDVDLIRDLLADFRARQDATGYWLPIYQERKLRSAIAAEGEYQAKLAAESTVWEAAKAAIPADYKTRHGAMYGGTVAFNGERIHEPGLDTSNLPWVKIAWHDKRVRDLTGESLINGRVMNSDVMYSAQMADGRQIYRISHYGSFGDDLRETYYFPPDVWHEVMLREVKMRGITVQVANAWLGQFRGCVGTELYEFAAEQTTSAVRLEECNALQSPRKQSLLGGTKGR